jgi:hypothetical protein
VRAKRGAILDLRLDDDWPVADRDIIETWERIDGPRDLPDRAEISRGLLLQRGGHLGEFRRSDTGDVLGDQSHVTQQHPTPPSRVRQSEVNRSSLAIPG